jgi:hypothetical protein
VPAVAGRCTPAGSGFYNGGREEPADHAVGRSRGGLTTKIHLACDGLRRPLSIVLTGGNVNDCTRHTGRSEPLCSPIGLRDNLFHFCAAVGGPTTGNVVVPQRWQMAADTIKFRRTTSCRDEPHSRSSTPRWSGSG